MSELKKALRKSIVASRRLMEENVRKNIDEKIYNNLAALPEMTNRSAYLVYASSPDETDTRRLINALLAEGRTVAVPKCEGKEMRFLTIGSLSELRKSRFGVDEPANGREITDFAGTVCIVPALRYDRNGFRLGWGGGFYDRFLAGYSGTAIGICYENDCGDIPAEPTDIPVGIVITENGRYR